MTTTTTAAQRPSTAKGWVSFLDFVQVSHGRAAALLLAFTLLTFLPGFFQIPPIDRDEPRFAQASKQMVESGEYVDIHFQDEVRYKKPVGIYWLQAAAEKAGESLGVPQARTAIWLYRIPSLLGAVGAVLLTYWVALAFVSRRAAVLAALMLASSVLVGTEARLAKTDAVLLFTILAAMGVLARAYLRGPMTGWLLPAIFWTAIAAGILIKGPLIVMIVGLTAATLAIWDRSARWMLALRPIAGVVWMALLVAPWFIAILSRSGNAFLADSVGQDMLSKLLSGQELHGAPPGYYLLLFWATFWPAAPLAGLAAPAVWRARNDPRMRFLLSWIVPSWIVFELVMTKLPHYVMPLYPAIAIAIAWALEANLLSRARWLVLGAVWWFIIPLIICVLVAGGAWAIGQLNLIALPILAGAIVLSFLAWWRYQAEGAEPSLLRAIAAAVLVAIGAFGIVLPSLTPLFPSLLLARAQADAGCANPVSVSIGFQEPSLVFLAGTSTLLVATPAAGSQGVTPVDFLRQGGCRLAFVESEFEADFNKRVQEAGLHYVAGPRIDGFNINEGRWIHFVTYRPEQKQ
jgi:4-amino-4-deoxy-L-arabinose transferase-like glycosyltransferase